MGVNRSDYVMYGFNVPKEIYNAEDFYDKYQKYIEWAEGDFAMIDAGMSDNFCIFGLVIKTTNEHEGFDEPTELSFTPYEQHKEKLKIKYKEITGIDDEPKFFVLSRFS